MDNNVNVNREQERREMAHIMCMRQGKAPCGDKCEKHKMKVCQNQFKVGGRYIYAFDNADGHTEALVEIVKKTNKCATIKFIEIYEEHTGNGIFAYLLKTNGTIGASYEFLKGVTE